MKREVKISFFTGAALTLFFFLWIILIKNVDVKSVGVNGTDIGLSSLNLWFHNLTGVNLKIYGITDILEVIPFAVCTIYGAIGFFQLVGRRNLFKVDFDIILLGLYYIAVIMAFTYFEFFPLNYRPILIEGKMESSFPSSTTLLVLSVMPALIFMVNRRVKNITVKKIIVIITIVYTVFMAVGRLVSGVHWLTDIIGGVILSAGLFLIFRALVLHWCEERNKKCIQDFLEK